MRSLWLLFVYVVLLALGAGAPFIATLGYVWVDTFRPQEVAYILLDTFPVAMIMAIVAIGGYLVMDRRSPPALSLETVIQFSMAIWVTATSFWAEVPSEAWVKWDWAFKTLVFAAFVPFVIRSRVQIEAFAATYVFSLAANFVPFGIKTLISGGGYGTNLGLVQGNSGLAEGGLLSTVCLMAVPLAIFLSKYSQLTPGMKWTRWAYWFVAMLAIVTAIGTFERSALIGLVILIAYMWVRSKNKFGFGLVVIVVVIGVVFMTSSAWTDRISTIGSYQKENSAFVRILVWRWTIEYTASHPLGGGFAAFLIDHVDVPASGDDPGGVQFGRAFHSIYFEVLGEQGYPGLIMFLTVAISAFFRLRRVAKTARTYPELEWLAALADALQSGLAVFMTSGAFVGIAFQPMFWYFIAMSVSVRAYLWRVENPAAKGATAQRPAARLPGGAPAAAGWRNRAGASGLPGT